MSVSLLLGALLAFPGAASGAEGEEAPSVIKQDITIKARGAVGPPVKLPPPAAVPQVLDEVVDSLEIFKRRQEGGVPVVKLPATRRRLESPFPKAPYLIFASKSHVDYDRWIFKVLSGREEVWRTSGEGGVRDFLDWDGSGPSGEMISRVGRSYRFEFLGWRGGEEYSLASESIRITSLSYNELLGGIRLEVSNGIIFGKGARISKEGLRYLRVMGDRMRNARMEEEPYRLVLYQKSPRFRQARRRARVLRDFLSKHLLAAKSRIVIDVRSLGKRGDVLVCLLPPEMGETFNLE